MNRFIGVDVQTSRPCPYAILDADGNALAAGWLDNETPERTVDALRDLLRRHAACNRHGFAVGIDAPRQPLPGPRQWYWRGSHWRKCGPQDQGAGRHCEIVIAAHRLANPQWTPARPPFPEWMRLGFALFQQLSTEFTLYEVFPSASYRMLRDDASAKMKVRLGDLAPHPKDMLDAYVAAATVREFIQGRGCEVGGDDGFGSIILPRRILKPIQEVLKWPVPLVS